MQQLNLRECLVSDISILKIWDQDPILKASYGEDSSFLWEEEIPNIKPWQEYLIAEKDGMAIGFVQIIDPLLEETHYWGDIPPNQRAIDIWIGDPENRGKGYGTHIMNLIFKRCFLDDQAEAIWVDPLKSNLKAINFYQKNGFESIEERVFEKELCLVMKRMNFL